jgi:type IV pilus assembly protein PilC
MQFKCRLGTPAGEVIEGIYVADNESRLRHELEERGLFVLSLQRRGAIAGWPVAFQRRRKVARHEFLVFNQELATLLKAGMPLVQSLDLLRHQVTNPVFKSVLNDVHEKVKAGTSLSDAFGDHGDLFPRVYTASLVAGEKSGNLDVVLRRYVAYDKVIGTVKQKTISALIYPAILIALALALVAIIVLKVVPAFSEFYASFGANLPLATRLIVGVSDVLRSQIVVIAVALVAIVAGVLTWVRRPGQKARFDRVVLQLPWVGYGARIFATSQLARTLATLLSGGIPLVNALEVAAKSIGNRYMAGQLEEVGQRVREGAGFARALEAKRILPDVALKMIEVGESTGSLQEMLNSLADFYDEEIETSVSRFVTIIEPALLVVMGIVIAALVLALYMPLFQLSSVVSTT